jgi:hypothetical protein
VDGSALGFSDGRAEGSRLGDVDFVEGALVAADGPTLGRLDGAAEDTEVGVLDGLVDGTTEGRRDGFWAGSSVNVVGADDTLGSDETDGTALGRAEGEADFDWGVRLGTRDGTKVGVRDGVFDGTPDGPRERTRDGPLDGFLVGASVNVVGADDPLDFSETEGTALGRADGDADLGAPLGTREGRLLAASLLVSFARRLGATDGFGDKSSVGVLDGVCDGVCDGIRDGDLVGLFVVVVGADETVGKLDRFLVGLVDGRADDASLGLTDGAKLALVVGRTDGRTLGCGDGINDRVGESVRSNDTSSSVASTSFSLLDTKTESGNDFSDLLLSLFSRDFSDLLLLFS